MSIYAIGVKLGTLTGGVMNSKIVFVVFVSFLSILYSKQIFGEYIYQYSDAETIIDAKQKCFNLAKKDAVEKFATFISSETVVRNYVTEKDEIIANSEALITDIQIVEEKIDRLNVTVYYKISAVIDEIKILSFFEEKERIRIEKLDAERKAQAERMEAERIAQEEKREADRKALAEKMEHERKIKEIEYKTKEIESSMQLNQKEKNYWKTQKWLALGAFVGTAGLGTYFNFQGGSYYDDYESATTTSTADDLYAKADDNYTYRDVTFSVSLVPLGYFFYSWYKESKY